MTRTINFTGHGANVVGSLGSGSLVQDMPPALSFDGDDYVLPTFTASRGVASTWTCWFKTDEWDTGRNGLMLTASEDMMVGVSDKDDNGKLYVGDFWGATTYRIRSQPLISGTWNFVARTTDGAGGIKLYVNNYPVTSTTGQSTAGSAAVFSIGDRATQDKGFTGQIRDVRVFDSELDSDEVAEVQDDIVMAGTSVTPVHWYQLEEGTGVTAQDSGSSEDDGAINGATWVKDKYNLNQIGSGSVSGSTTISGGTWNLGDSTSISFDGSTSHIDLSSSFTLSHDGSTVAFWVKKDNATGNQDTIIGESSDANQHWIKISTNGEVVLRDYPNDLGTSTQLADTNWNHVVITMSGDSNGAIYFNGVSQPLSANDIVADPFFDHFGSRNTTDPFDGELKDVKVYDTALTPSQVELLFKDQWLGSPVHWWKMTEGAGSTIADSGITGGKTGTLDSTTWVNPDYDITNVGAAANEGLTILSGTTLSAPRGELLLRAASPAGDPPDWRINGKYIHNSGTLTFSGTTTTDWYPANEADNTNAYYKVKQAGTKPQWHNGSWTVEHSINLQGNIRAYANSSHTNGHTLTVGTTGSVGYISGSAYIQAMTNTNGGSLIKSASENYPAVLSGTHASYGAIVSPYRSIQVSGVHMFGDCKTGNNGFENGSTLKILGNTVWGDKSGGGAEIMIPLTDSASNDTGQNLDVSGAAVHIKIPMYISGNMIVKDAAVFANKFMQSANRSFVHNDNSKIIYSHQTANNDNFIMPAISGQQMMNSNYRQYTNAAYDIKGDLIVGHTNTTGFRLNHNFNCRNIYVGDDANSVFDQNDKTLTVTGTKLSAVGGFIGACQGMFDNDPTTTPTEYITYASGQTIGSAMTMEAWVNTSDTNDQIFLKLYDPYTYLKVDDDGKVYGRIGSSGITTELGSTTVVDDGKWHHVALTFKQGDGGSKLYIDGILESQVEGDTGSVYNPNTFSIGADHSDMQKGLNGSLARVSVWKDNLSQDEILQMMFMDYLSVSSSAIDHTKCINWTQFDGKTNNTQVYNLASGSNNGTATTSDIWDVPNGYANWIKGTGSTAQTYLTSTEDIDFWGKNFRLSNVSGGATAGKKLKMTRWDGFEQTLQFYGAWKWGPGTLEQRNYSTYGDNAVPWCTANGNLAYVEEMSGTPFGDASNGLAAYWNSNYPTKPMTIKNMLPTDNVNLGGDLTIVGTMMPSLTSKSKFIDSHGYDMNLKQWKSYNGTIGELRLQAGSTLYFVNDNSGFSEGISSKSLIQIVASGETAYQATTDAAGTNTEGVYTNTEVVTSGTSQMSVSYWVQIPSDSNFWDTSLLRCVWGFGGIFTGEPTVASHPGMWAHTIQSSWIKNDFYSYDNPADADDDFSRIHENATRPINWTGTGPYGWHHICTTVAAGTAADTIKTYVDGVEVDSRQKPKEFLIVGNGSPGLSVHGTHLGDSESAYGTQMSIADFRIYKDITLTSGNTVTLASENPATSVSGAYADPTNTLGATLWWKLNATPSGTLDATDSAGSNNGTAYGGAKSGFTRILPSGTTNAWEFNNGTGDKRLTNFYLSGSSGDIMVSNSGTANGAGNYYPGSLTTKGTVVFD